MDDVNIFAFLLSLSLSVSRSFLFFLARYKEARQGTRGDQGKKREKVEGEGKRLFAIPSPSWTS